MSIKLDLKPTELANKSAIKRQFSKIIAYYNKFFLDLDISEDNDLDKED
jgi:hypothetical protein